MKIPSLLIVAMILAVGANQIVLQSIGILQHPVVDFPPPPPTLQEFAGVVDAVVVARVQRAGDPVLEKGPSREFVRRYHQMEVLELLKADSAMPLGRRFLVRQEGGTVEQAGREVSTQYLQQLMETGDTFLLFLRRVPDSVPGRYYTALGPAGAIWVDPKDRMGRIPGELRRLKEIHGRERVDLDELLRAIRRAGL